MASFKAEGFGGSPIFVPVFVQQPLAKTRLLEGMRLRVVFDLNGGEGVVAVVEQLATLGCDLD